MPASSDTASTLAQYRPVLDRLLFVLALLGVLTTVHLQIQQERGFDRGCLGFTTSEAVEASFNCEAVTQSAAGQLGGVSNAILGMLFYLAVGGLTVGAAFSMGSAREWLKRGRAGLIAIGFAYSVYLSYIQYFVLDDLCALCLISASLATLLFLGQATEFLTSPPSSSDMQFLKKARGVRFYGIVAALILGLVAADLLYFNNLEESGIIDFDQVSEAEATSVQPVSDETADASTENAERPADREEATPPQSADGADAAIAGDAGPAPTKASSEASSEAVVVPDDCEYDPEKGAVSDYDALVSMSDPTKGTADAPVTVIEYFDPMCPHCKFLQPVMEQVMAEQKGNARFVYKPIVLLGQRSVAPVAALLHAAREGKFFEMLDLIFANQKPSGYSLQELRQYAQQIGLSPDVMENRLRGGIYSPTMKRQREEFIGNGFNSVPTLMIDGRVVKSSSRSVECVSSLISEAAMSN